MSVKNSQVPYLATIRRCHIARQLGTSKLWMKCVLNAPRDLIQLETISIGQGIDLSSKVLRRLREMQINWCI